MRLPIQMFVPCLVFLGAWTSSPVPGYAQTGGLGAEVRGQVRAMIEEKRTRTPVERKLDSQLVYGLREARGQPPVPGAPRLRADLYAERDGRILVDLDAVISDGLLDAVRAGGGEVVNHYPSFRSARVLVPLPSVEQLAGRNDVFGVRRADRAITRVGTVTSEGDTTHAAAGARTTFGVDGSGIKVGVLSDSVDFLADAQAGGDLPAVTVLAGQSGVPESGEGTAMLEIIHDLAPGADLYFATAFQSEAGFAQNILDLRAAGCDIIVDDVGYFNESPFQDAPIADAVNAVTADGTLYFSSAGNAGNKNDGTSSTWEGDFVSAGPAGSPVNEGTLHSFGATTYNTVLSGGSALRLDLFWSDPLGDSSNDYDLYVLNSTGTAVLRSSTDSQNGSQDPYERITTLNVGERVVIVKHSGDDRFLHLSAGRGRLGISTPGEIRGHPASANAFAVAAVDADTSFPSRFSGGGTNPVETFSSDGPRRVFYLADGTPITPGDASSSGGVVRDKPDLAAADRVRTSVPGFDPFVGTSAAAPHAAAVAALLLSYNPGLSSTEVRDLLTGTALDIEAPGPDRDAGAGIVVADALLQAAPAPVLQPEVVMAGWLVIEETCATTNGAIDPGEVVSAELSLANLGTAATSNLVVTLLNTNGVTSFSSPAVYGNIPTGGVAVSLFSFSAEGTCGDVVDAVFGLNDGTNDLGLVLEPLTLGQRPRQATSVANTTPIEIPRKRQTGTGSPYPSSLVVSGVTSPVVKVTVTLYDLEHPYPDDIDLLLVAPSGEAVVLMSDAGGGSDLAGVELTFDDEAGSAIPDETLMTSGTYRPANYGGSDSFAGPAPAGPYATDLGAFNGLAANGTWSLYVVDDSFFDVGDLHGGWSLSVFAEGDPVCCTNLAQRPPVIGPIADVQGLEDAVTGPLPLAVSDADTHLTNLVFTVGSTNESLLSAEHVSLDLDGTNYVFSVEPEPDAFGETRVTISVQDEEGAAASNSFLYTVLPVNDAPTLDSLPNVSVSGTAGVQFVALEGIGSGAGNEDQVVAVTAITDTPLLITNVMVTYTSPANGGTLSFTPVPAEAGEADIFIMVEDDGGLTHGGVDAVTQQFTVVVLPVFDTDGDLLPDDYEKDNALDPLDANDAALDPDEDGLSTLQEFLAGTDPNDGNDVLALRGISIVSNGVEVMFQSVSGNTYAVETADEFTTTSNWVNAEALLVSTGALTRVVDTNSSPNVRAYRVRFEP